MSAVKVVAITGAARGIGREIAQAFRHTGTQVAIGDVDLSAARDTAADIGAHAFALDVSDPTSVEEFHTEVTRSLGPIDVFVNNAGIMWVGRFDAEPHAAARAQIEVNLLGVINGVKTVAPQMAKRGRGHLITVASAASILPTPGEATYAATKHGVLGYLKAVRAETRGTGVRFSTIMPAVVDTTLAAGTSSGAAPLLTPAEVARAVVRTATRPRFEVTVPGFIGPAVRAIGVLPEVIRDRILAAVVPDQVAEVRTAERRDYESGFLATGRASAADRKESAAD